MLSSVVLFDKELTDSGWTQWKLKMTLANLIPKNVVPFFAYTR